jgi:hypothetical protein
MPDNQNNREKWMYCRTPELGKNSLGQYGLYFEIFSPDLLHDGDPLDAPLVDVSTILCPVSTAFSAYLGNTLAGSVYERELVAAVCAACGVEKLDDIVGKRMRVRLSGYAGIEAISDGCSDWFVMEDFFAGIGLQ